jgi:hypothetical protein
MCGSLCCGTCVASLSLAHTASRSTADTVVQNDQCYMTLGKRKEGCSTAASLQAQASLLQATISRTQDKTHVRLLAFGAPTCPHLHVTWLHPPFFSTSLLHLGQGFVLAVIQWRVCVAGIMSDS